MKTLQKISIAFLFMLTILSCKKADVVQEPSSISTITGKWKLVNTLTGDIINRPCGNNSPTRDITLEFTSNPSGVNNLFSLNGQSAVNEYFGNYEADSKGVIKITNLGGTKRGGSPEMMRCETNYYAQLAISKSYRIIQDGTNPVKTVLHIGIFGKGGEDGGNYLIFEKIN